MQRRTMAMMSALCAAGMISVGCSSGDGASGPSVSACADDTDCTASEICHPDAKVCVTTCTGAADCSAEAPTCATLSPADARMICKCTSDTACNGGRSHGDLVCSTAYGICDTKCTSHVDCAAGHTCDTGTGQCQPIVAGP